MLVLPKFVRFTNWKLNAIYYVLCSVMFFVLLIRFFASGHHLMEVTPRGRVSPWAEGYSEVEHEQIMAVFNQSLVKDFCTNPGLFEYWYDAVGVWKYGPHRCLPPCPPGILGVSRDTCMHMSETQFQDAPDEVFFVTEFGEKYPDSDLDFRYYFAGTTEALSVAFDYFFHVYDSGFWSSRSYGWEEKHERRYSSGKDILTIVIDKEGEPVQVLKPPGPILLTVPEMLKLAGKSFDNIQPESGPNKKAGAAFPSGPLARISGLELRISLSCYNSPPISINEDWDGPACLARVHPTSTYWAWKHTRELVKDDGSMRHRRYHGLRVRFEVAGSYDFWDFNNIFLNIASFIVFMGLPAKFMLFVCLYLLGHISVMYRQAIYERVDILDQCAGMAARLMSMSAAFVELGDVSGEDGVQAHGISRGRVKERLQRVVQHRNDVLSEKEVEHVVDCCFHTMVSYHHESKGGLPLEMNVRRWRANLDQMGNMAKRAKISIVGNDKPVEASEVITIDDFSVAHSSIEHFTFQSFLELFNKGRKTTFLERFFMPLKIRTCLENAERHALLRGLSGHSFDASQPAVKDSPVAVVESVEVEEQEQSVAVDAGALTEKSSVRTESATLLGSPAVSLGASSPISPTRSSPSPRHAHASSTLESKKRQSLEIPERIQALEIQISDSCVGATIAEDLRGDVTCTSRQVAQLSADLASSRAQVSLLTSALERANKESESLQRRMSLLEDLVRDMQRSHVAPAVAEGSSLQAASLPQMPEGNPHAELPCAEGSAEHTAVPGKTGRPARTRRRAKAQDDSQEPPHDAAAADTGSAQRTPRQRSSSPAAPVERAAFSQSQLPDPPCSECSDAPRRRLSDGELVSRRKSSRKSTRSLPPASQNELQPTSSDPTAV
mmetsp:Transcript_160317/g.307640  ORF Transcript_160317/g.307640 Transcript_160317/m.307640 type:complete len:893 (-) Transcript_160317:50-2728(-)